MDKQEKPALAEKQVSAVWQRLLPDVKVLDPDGWDRQNYPYSWYEELITIEEYKQRRLQSTCAWGWGSLLKEDVPVEPAQPEITITVTEYNGIEYVQLPVDNEQPQFRSQSPILQPELPKELPLVSKPHWSENMATSRAYIEGLEDQNDADQIILDKWVEAFQQAMKEGYKKGVEDNYNMGQIDLEQALKRIAELPKELPLVSDEIIWEAFANAGRNEVAATQQGADQAIYQQALKRIAGLEAEIEVRDTRIANLELTKEEALLSIRRLTTAVNQYEGQTDAEIASLKEQLAVFTKDIPEGKYCWITSNREGMCPYHQGGMCFICRRELRWNRETAEYEKAPGCPVPAKEEEKP